MRVLVVGGGGYIGSVLCSHLIESGNKIICLDRFFFGEETVSSLSTTGYFTLVRADIRQLPTAVFKDVDAVIQLAGLSNDPCSELNPEWTTTINYEGTIQCAQLARKAGVKRFIFASSCSVYGHAEQMPVTEESPCNPVSLYAQSKLEAEIELAKLSSSDFTVAFMRNATVYGLSPRVRYDLIVNSMTVHAYLNKKVYILGGGEQWRPLIHVKDVCRAIECMLQAPAIVINARAFNIGSNEQNYRVHEVAAKVKQLLPNVTLETVPEDADKRSYNVNFDRISSELNFKCIHTPEQAIQEIYDALVTHKIDPLDPRGITCKYYTHLINSSESAKAVLLSGRLFD